MYEWEELGGNLKLIFISIRNNLKDLYFSSVIRWSQVVPIGILNRLTPVFNRISPRDFTSGFTSPWYWVFLRIEEKERVVNSVLGEEEKISQ